MSLAARWPYLATQIRTRTRRGVVSTATGLVLIAAFLGVLNLVSSNTGLGASGALALIILGIALPVIATSAAARERDAGHLVAAGRGALSTDDVLAGLVFGAAWIEWLTAATAAVVADGVISSLFGSFAVWLTLLVPLITLLTLGAVVVRLPPRVPSARAWVMSVLLGLTGLVYFVDLALFEDRHADDTSLARLGFIGPAVAVELLVCALLWSHGRDVLARRRLGPAAAALRTAVPALALLAMPGTSLVISLGFAFTWVVAMAFAPAWSPDATTPRARALSTLRHPVVAILGMVLVVALRSPREALLVGVAGLLVIGLAVEVAHRQTGAPPRADDPSIAPSAHFTDGLAARFPLGFVLALQLWRKLRPRRTPVHVTGAVALVVALLWALRQLWLNLHAEDQGRTHAWAALGYVEMALLAATVVASWAAFERDRASRALERHARSGLGAGQLATGYLVGAGATSFVVAMALGVAAVALGALAYTLAGALLHQLVVLLLAAVALGVVAIYQTRPEYTDNRLDPLSLLLISGCAYVHSKLMIGAHAGGSSVLPLGGDEIPLRRSFLQALAALAADLVACGFDGKLRDPSGRLLAVAALACGVVWLSLFALTGRAIRRIGQRSPAFALLAPLAPPSLAWLLADRDPGTRVASVLTTAFVVALVLTYRVHRPGIAVEERAELRRTTALTMLLSAALSVVEIPWGWDGNTAIQITALVVIFALLAAKIAFHDSLFRFAASRWPARRLMIASFTYIVVELLWQKSYFPFGRAPSASILTGELWRGQLPSYVGVTTPSALGVLASIAAHAGDLGRREQLLALVLAALPPIGLSLAAMQIVRSLSATQPPRWRRWSGAAVGAIVAVGTIRVVARVHRASFDPLVLLSLSETVSGEHRARHAGEAIAHDDTNPAAHFAMASANKYETGAGCADLAIAEYGKVIRMRPRYAASYSGRADVYDGKARSIPAEATELRALALKDRMRAAELDPENTEARWDLGSACLIARDFECASKEISEVIARLPEDAKAHAKRAEAYSNLGNPAAAVPDYDSVLRLSPGYADILFLRGKAHAAYGDNAAALVDYTLAIVPTLDEPLSGRDLLVERARLYLSLGRVDEALVDLDAAINKEIPGFFGGAPKADLAAAFAERSHVRSSRGDGPGALADMEAAASMAPSNAVYSAERDQLKAPGAPKKP